MQFTRERVSFLRNKVFAAVFFAFIIAVMISAPVKMFLTNAGVIETENVGNVIEVEKVYVEGTFGAPFFNAVEEAKRDINDIYTNYIPFYVRITSIAESFTQQLNRPISTFLLEWGNRLMLGDQAGGDTTDPTGPSSPTGPTEPTKPFVPRTNAYFLKKNSRHRYYEVVARTGPNDPVINFYIRIPSEDAAALHPTMLKQAAAINDFAARRPDVNWYVFPVTCFEDTALCEQILPAESKHKLFTEFFTKLDKSIQYDYLKIDDVKVKNSLYFKTDHHWNVYGYTEGYRLITEMFKKNYPDLQARTPVIYTFDDTVKVFGSNALAVANYKMYDFFHVADFSLPEHTYVKETGVSYGGKESFQQSLERYLNKQHNTKASYNHYINFCPIVKEVTYPQNNTGRNLLIIGDSYALPLLEVLASHFDNTYIRYVDSNKELSNIEYGKLIDQYKITDVLMLEMSDRVIYDYYSDSLQGLK